MPYAVNNQVSTSPIEGGIEITEHQYTEALAGMSAGRLVSIDGGFAVIDPPVPETPSSPAPTNPGPPPSVSAAQGGIALIRAGLMDDAQAAVDDPTTPDEVKWAWAKATIWDRTSPAFNYIADKAGITEAQKDALFVDASHVVP